MDKNKTQALEWLKAANDDLDSISYIIKVEHKVCKILDIDKIEVIG